MATKLFDSTIVGTAEQALEFIGNILESSTEYSIVGKDLDGRILLWNEGARRLGSSLPAYFTEPACAEEGVHLTSKEGAVHKLRPQPTGCEMR